MRESTVVLAPGSWTGVSDHFIAVWLRAQHSGSEPQFSHQRNGSDTFPHNVLELIVCVNHGTVPRS